MLDYDYLTFQFSIFFYMKNLFKTFSIIQITIANLFNPVGFIHFKNFFMQKEIWPDDDLT